MHFLVINYLAHKSRELNNSDISLVYENSEVPIPLLPITLLAACGCNVKLV